MKMIIAKAENCDILEVFVRANKECTRMNTSLLVDKHTFERALKMKSFYEKSVRIEAMDLMKGTDLRYYVLVDGDLLEKAQQEENGTQRFDLEAALDHLTYGYNDVFLFAGPSLMKDLERLETARYWVRTLDAGLQPALAELDDVLAWRGTLGQLADVYSAYFVNECPKKAEWVKIAVDLLDGMEEGHCLALQGGGRSDIVIKHGHVVVISNGELESMKEQAGGNYNIMSIGYERWKSDRDALLRHLESMYVNVKLNYAIRAAYVMLLGVLHLPTSYAYWNDKISDLPIA